MTLFGFKYKSDVKQEEWFGSFSPRTAMVQATKVTVFCIVPFFVVPVFGTWIEPSVLDACPGYNVTNPIVQGVTLTAKLNLAGTACNVFGTDLEELSLTVTYETGECIYLFFGNVLNYRNRESHPRQNH